MKITEKTKNITKYLVMDIERVQMSDEDFSLKLREAQEHINEVVFADAGEHNDTSFAFTSLELAWTFVGKPENNIRAICSNLNICDNRIWREAYLKITALTLKRIFCSIPKS